MADRGYEYGNKPGTWLVLINDASAPSFEGSVLIAILNNHTQPEAYEAMIKHHRRWAEDFKAYRGIATKCVIVKVDDIDPFNNPY